MLIKRPADCLPSEITPQALFEQRRAFIRTAGLGSIAGAATLLGLDTGHVVAANKLAGVQKSPFSIDEKTTPLKDVTSYNNFY